MCVCVCCLHRVRACACVCVLQAGFAAFGPHMYWAGIQFRADQKANDQKEREFAQASSRERAAVLAAHRKEILEETIERFEKEMGERPPSEEEELAAIAGAAASSEDDHGDVKRMRVYNLMVRTRPNAAHLRFRITPDKQRSSAYALHPSEDRPELVEQSGEEAGPPGAGLSV